MRVIHGSTLILATSDCQRDKLLDGQFEESTLTLSEINLIQESLTKSLISIFHTRIKYPEQRAG